jgi:hypothetical protein
MIFVDDGTFSPDKSLTFFFENRKFMHGRIVRVVCLRATPMDTYNTRLYSENGDEMKLSGMTCGKVHRATHALIELLKSLRDDWGTGMTDEDIKKIAYSNNKVELEFHPS